jgi:hypothetical protein
MNKAKPSTASGNLQLPNGNWINTNLLTNEDYKKALRIGIATLINLGELKYDDVKAPPGDKSGSL